MLPSPPVESSRCSAAVGDLVDCPEGRRIVIRSRPEAVLLLAAVGNGLMAILVHPADWWNGLVGAAALLLGVWSLNPRDTLYLTEGRVILLRSLLGLTRAFSFRRERIINVRVGWAAQEVRTCATRRPLLMDKPNDECARLAVRFDYEGRTRRFGVGLTRAEADFVVAGLHSG